jgi:hypothetical protein
MTDRCGSLDSTDPIIRGEIARVLRTGNANGRVS